MKIILSTKKIAEIDKFLNIAIVSNHIDNRDRIYIYAINSMRMRYKIIIL